MTDNEKRELGEIAKGLNEILSRLLLILKNAKDYPELHKMLYGNLIKLHKKGEE